MTNPMTCDQFADQLAEYLEGDVDATTRVAMETHASSCAECGALLADLRTLQVDAGKLPELTPKRDLWAGIAARIETPVVELKNDRTVERWSGGTKSRVNRTSRAWIGLAAAGLVVATATITHQVTKRSMVATTPPQTVAVQPKPDTARSTPPATQVANADTVPPVHRSAVPASRLASSKPSAEQTYEVEIARLRTVLNRRRPQLDSSTVAVVEHNLEVIDDAIAQCKRALQKDPASRFLMESLNDALDTKVQLLRTAATLPSTT
ncbi:MAG TPA: zf-HC2 domain-containing protein [Gemmatimonadaceae bacterium]